MSIYLLRKDLNFITKLFYTTIYILYFVSRFLGIACFTYDSRRHRARESWQTRLYTALMLIITMVSMPFAIYILYTEMTFLRQNQLLTYVGYIRYGMVLLCAWATLYMQLHYRQDIMDCFNKMLKLRHLLQKHLNHRRNHHYRAKRVIWNIMAKCLTIILQFMWIIFLILNDKASQRFWYLITLLYVQYCQLVLVTTLNLLFYGCWLLALITQELNFNLLEYLKQMKCLSYHRFGYHRYHLQYICQQLQQLLPQHWLLYKMSRKYLRLYSWQIVCFLTFVIIECVTQIFIMYFVAVGVLFNQHDRKLRHGAVGTIASVHKGLEGNDFDQEEEQQEKQRPKIIINPYALLYVFGIIWDMFVILLMINEMRLSFFKTRFIFSKGLWLKTLLSPANQLLDKCVSIFSSILV